MIELKCYFVPHTFTICTVCVDMPYLLRRTCIHSGDCVCVCDFMLQVTPSTVFLTDATNMAVFPANNGFFSSLDLTPRAQYEVHGAVAEAQASPQPARFSFARQGASASATCQSTVGHPPRATQSKTYQR